jgi:hypothetical protein
LKNEEKIKGKAIKITQIFPLSYDGQFDDRFASKNKMELIDPIKRSPASSSILAAEADNLQEGSPYYLSIFYRGNLK